MKDFMILTDSCADLPVELLNEKEVLVLPLSLTIDGNKYENYADERSIKNKDLYQMLRDHKMATTTQLTPQQVIDAVAPIMAAGQDILAIQFSSALSGTYNSVCVAKEELLSKYPDRKMIVIDSLSASLGQGLLIHLALEQKRAGKSLEELAKWVESKKLNIIHLFTVDDLNHLKRGGRLSASKAFLGTLLQLKPILHVDNEGRLVPLHNVRARKQSLKELVKLLDETINETADTVFISHGDCLEDAQFVEELIKENHPNMKIVIGYVGPVIGAHSGPGTVAIFFEGKLR